MHKFETKIFVDILYLIQILILSIKLGSIWKQFIWEKNSIVHYLKVLKKLNFFLQGIYQFLSLENGKL